MQNQQDPSTKSESNREFGWEREIIEKLALAAVIGELPSGLLNFLYRWIT